MSRRDGWGWTKKIKISYSNSFLHDSSVYVTYTEYKNIFKLTDKFANENVCIYSVLKDAACDEKN